MISPANVKAKAPTGAAMSIKMRSTDQVAVCFLGKAL